MGSIVQVHHDDPDHGPVATGTIGRWAGGTGLGMLGPSHQFPHPWIPVPILRAVVAALAVAVLLSAAPSPSPATAAEPHRPVPGHQPAFVTERQAGPWEDCLWASAAMFVDKWTAGAVRVDRKRLRALSGDRDGGGSTLGQLRQAFDRIGMPVRTSPDGGERISWPVLLDRLANGGGAILLGDYGRLPQRYGRWDPAFWQKTGDEDNHAVYLDRYDARSGRVWVMDPLAPADWTGEWVPVSALKAYAWRTGGALHALVTPPAEPAPFAGIEIGPPAVADMFGTVRTTWPILATPADWTAPGVDPVVTLQPAEDPIAAAARGLPSVLVMPTTVSAPPPPPAAEVARDRLALDVPAPLEPGPYLFSASLNDRRFGRPVASTGPHLLFAAGPWRGVVLPDAAPPVVATRDAIHLGATVFNVGARGWVLDAVAGSEEASPPRDTRLVGTWVRVEDGERGSTRSFGSLALPPATSARLMFTAAAPPAPGRWALVLEIVDVDGSLVDRGSPPAVVTFEVTEPTAPADPAPLQSTLREG